jgi:hypothetical protein
VTQPPAAVFRLGTGLGRGHMGPCVVSYLGEAVTAPARGGGFLLGEKQGAGHRPVRKDEQRKRLANAAQLAICIHGKS